MKKSILLGSILISLFSCQQNEVPVELPAAIPIAVVPEPAVVTPVFEANSFVGNWYVTKIFNLATPIGKSPKNATISLPAYNSFLVMEDNGKASLSRLSISNYGFDPYNLDSFLAAFAIDKDILKLTVTISGKKYVNYFKVKSVTAKNMVLFQDKALFIKALEDKKATVGEKSYNQDMALYKENDRYESEITLLK